MREWTEEKILVEQSFYEYFYDWDQGYFHNPNPPKSPSYFVGLGDFVFELVLHKTILRGAPSSHPCSLGVAIDPLTTVSVPMPRWVIPVPSLDSIVGD